MYTTIITDCKGENEAGRQITRYHALGLGPASLVGVASTFGLDSTIEAAGNLIDMLDASEGKKGTVVSNVAPRGVVSDGHNGNYFCYFFYKETLVISSTKGHCLSLVKTFGLTDSVFVLPTEKVLEYAKEKNLITEEQKEYITKTQFRSFDFVPRVARWIHDGEKLPVEKLALTDVSPMPQCIWCIDAFGNCKTTLTREDVPGIPGEKVKTSIGEFTFYERLKDVPDGETALYVGSSGFGNKRFLELATQNREGSVAKKLNLQLGQQIEIQK